MLQETAWNQVKDSAYVHGYYKLTPFHTDFSVHSDNLDITVSDSSSSMINKKVIYWGDGDSTLIMPVLFQDFNTATHSYSQVGDYTITQKNWWSACDSGEVTLSLSQPLSIHPMDTNPTPFTIYPNPTNGFIKIKSNQNSYELKEIKVFDTQGRLLISIQKSMNNEQLTIDVCTIPNQLLFITLTDINGREHKVKILKE